MWQVIIITKHERYLLPQISCYIMVQRIAWIQLYMRFITAMSITFVLSMKRWINSINHCIFFEMLRPTCMNLNTITLAVMIFLITICRPVKSIHESLLAIVSQYIITCYNLDGSKSCSFSTRQFDKSHSANTNSCIMMIGILLITRLKGTHIIFSNTHHYGNIETNQD